MGYHTKNELHHFRFEQSEVYEVRQYRNQLIFTLGYVTILPENTCNRDIREMGTNELELKLLEVSDVKFIHEGFRLYDADGNLKQETEDKVLDATKLCDELKDVCGLSIFELQKKDETYIFYLDTEEDGTYRLEVIAGEDTQDWERFMNRESSY